MADTAVDTDTEVMVDTVEVMGVTDMVDTVASDLLLPKLIPMLKLKLTVTVMAVDTDMVDTVEVMEVTDMVDTVASDLPLPKLIPTLKPKLTVTDMVDTVEVMEVTVMAVDTVMAVEVTTDRFY